MTNIDILPIYGVESIKIGAYVLIWSPISTFPLQNETTSYWVHVADCGLRLAS